MEIPPGFIYLAQIIPRLLILLVAVFGTNKLFVNTIPQWLQILACLLVFAVAIYSNGIIVHYHHQRQARLRGAVLVPKVPNRWPGGIERLVEILHNLRHGYIAEPYDKVFLVHGNTICFRILFEDKIVTSEPEYIKSMLITQFNSFPEHLGSLLGTGVFNSDGDVWKFHRSMTRPFFSKDRVNDFNTFERHADDAIGQLKVRLREGHPVDFQDMVYRFTLDSATDFLLGKDVCSLSAGLVYPPSSPLSKNPAILRHPANQFAYAFHKSQIYTLSRAIYGASWRLGELWEDKVKKQMKICYKFIDPILDAALEKKKAMKNNKSSSGDLKTQEGNTLLDHLVNVSDDPVLIRDETLSIMLASRDTTAVALTFIVYMLSQHPKVMHRLRDEVLSKFGLSKRPTHEDMRDMKYMRAVINETLRLFPPIPFNVRTSCKPTVWPAVNGSNPIFVPANTPVTFCVFLMHRRTDLWGPDALEFDPDRFLDERLRRYLIPNPSIFIPFHAGPRTCPGQQFAYNEMSFFLIRLLQNFSSISLDLKTQTLPPPEWANEPGRKGVDKIIIKTHLTTFVKDGLWVTMEEAATA